MQVVSAACEARDKKGRPAGELGALHEGARRDQRGDKAGGALGRTLNDFEKGGRLRSSINH